MPRGIHAGAGGHGYWADVTVVGASGICYGVVWSQVALLALNWREMPARWFRLGMLSTLATMELCQYFFSYNARVSYMAHLNGAAAGVAIGLVCGVNTVFEDWELWLCALGTGTYLFLIVTFLATEQTAVACWCLPVLPVLFFDAWRSYMRAKNRRIVLPSAVAAM